jgi:hypothetical protein
MSDSAGMIYLAGLIRLGTAIKKSAELLTDPSPDDMINECQNDTAACLTAENGEILIEIGSAYCHGDVASSGICATLNESISAHPGDPEQILNYFLNQIKSI